MRRYRLLILIAVVIAALGAGAGVAEANVSYEAILPQFMCVSCHEPLELVSSPQAISEKQTLQQFVQRGLSLSEIKSEMVGQYGEQVLAKPPAQGFNLAVYIIPPVVVVAGLLLLIYTLPKWRRRSREAAKTSLPEAAPLDEREAERLDAELDQFI